MPLHYWNVMPSSICYESITKRHYFAIQALASTVRQKWVWFWLKYRAVNCQSSYSRWVFSQPRALFVCALSAVQSHSKWIICHSGRIVSDQIICCTSAGPIPAQNPGWTPVISAIAVILWVCTQCPSLGLKWIAPLSVVQQTQHPYFVQAQKNPKQSSARVRAFCIGSTKKNK